jgi:hypothetical protein
MATIILKVAHDASDANDYLITIVESARYSKARYCRQAKITTTIVHNVYHGFCDVTTQIEGINGSNLSCVNLFHKKLEAYAKTDIKTLFSDAILAGMQRDKPEVFALFSKIYAEYQAIALQNEDGFYKKVGANGIETVEHHYDYFAKKCGNKENSLKFTLEGHFILFD